MEALKGMIYTSVSQAMSITYKDHISKVSLLSFNRNLQIQKWGTSTGEYVPKSRNDACTRLKSMCQRGEMMLVHGRTHGNPQIWFSVAGTNNTHFVVTSAESTKITLSVNFSTK
jgi:hypothetical protein